VKLAGLDERHAPRRLDWLGGLLEVSDREASGSLFLRFDSIRLWIEWDANWLIAHPRPWAFSI
jgi:hypothetical protein